jgi:hypothetical protein
MKLPFIPILGKTFDFTAVFTDIKYMLLQQRILLLQKCNDQYIRR